jgi:tetratricopeptide (TPR) repeat protein
VRLGKFVSLVDIVVVVVGAVAIFLPARPLEGVAAARSTDDDQFALAAAEARARLAPDDGGAAADLSRRLMAAGQLDLAVEAPQLAAAKTGSPSRWRALLATSWAYAERLEVKDADEWAQRALAACQASACPSWEEVRIDLYVRHLDAGLRSGIDPKVDPDGFRRAGESALRTVHLTTNPQTTEPFTAPHDAGAGSGSATP